MGMEVVLSIHFNFMYFHQEHTQLYLQRLALVKPLLLPIVEELERSSNSSTIAAGSSNSLTSAKCCKYSCVCS